MRVRRAASFHDVRLIKGRSGFPSYSKQPSSEVPAVHLNVKSQAQPEGTYTFRIWCKAIIDQTGIKLPSNLLCCLSTMETRSRPESSVQQQPRRRQAAPLAATQDTSGGQRHDPCPVLQPLARPNGHLQLRTMVPHCGRQEDSEVEMRGGG